ncbi:CBU_0592 family membrane protein [Maribacter sp. ACAM166]|uniref:CBU_0592 family membrane protein n=1 Tax=Maribacter sp. ACAM166 TaxID=2508996 RepID=UPI0010FD7478|nr:hypothetical protein [Maribacter sp. ACAM166]TLP80722.1 hypothetical protein ES765_06580 [Maribacter sp. ACAM166]
MNVEDWIGFAGVFQILLAYVLNLTGNASNQSTLFLLLNFIGASMACLASVLLNYLPFIILEGIWALVSLVTLLKQRLR